MKFDESISVDGKSICLKKSSVEELQNALVKVKKEEEQLIIKQNDLLSKICN